MKTMPPKQEPPPMLSFQYTPPPPPRMPPRQDVPNFGMQNQLQNIFGGMNNYNNNLSITGLGAGVGDNNVSIGNINEDYLPPVSMTTLGERSTTYQTVRANIFNNQDGESISLEGGRNSLQSFLKLAKINPYNSYKLSPNVYKGLPNDFLIYNSCYPIRYQMGSTTCAPNATMANIRIYKLTEGSFLANRLDPESYFNYDEWREIAFYQYIREYIIKPKTCPHFPTIFGYFICENSNIEFDKIALFKKQEVAKRIEPQYISNNNNARQNGVQSGGAADNMVQTILNYIQAQNNKNIQHGGTAGNILTNLQSINDGNINSVNRRILGNEELEQLPGKLRQIEQQPINTSQLNNGAKIVSSSDKLVKFITGSGTTIEINPKAYLRKVLAVLTEAPTHNILSWASKIYVQKENVKEQINPGVHSEKEWMNILFQMMVGLYSMQIHGLIIKDFKLDTNVFIKDTPLRGPVTNYWKYKIDNVNFYIPNLGYLVLIDSNFRNVNDSMSTNIEPTMIANRTNVGNEITHHKLNGKFLGNHCKLTDEQIKNEVFEMFKSAFDVNQFGNDFIQYGGVKPPTEIITLMGNIHTDAMQDAQKDIKHYLINYMKYFMHNRIGGYLKENEITLIRKEDNSEFKKGQLVIYENGYDSYKIVMFLGIENNTATILTKNDPGDKDIIEVKNIAITSLFNYAKGEQIMQNFKPTDALLNEDEILETYVVV